MRVAEDVRALVHDAGLCTHREMSISIGVAELVVDQSCDDWMENADAALYRAKRAGRNRVAGNHGTATRSERLFAVRS
jgi:diguanylate cyclase (GGDEF)-like protein